jgi:hypothetical protein
MTTSETNKALNHARLSTLRRAKRQRNRGFNLATRATTTGENDSSMHRMRLVTPRGDDRDL